MSLSANAYWLVAHIMAVWICITISAQSAMIALGDTNNLVYRYFSALALVAAVYLGSTAYYYQAGSLALAVLALKYKSPQYVLVTRY